MELPFNFALFKNERKTNDNQPDLVGPYKDMDGNITEYEIAAWKKTKGGRSYYSVSIKKRTPKPLTPPDGLKDAFDSL